MIIETNPLKLEYVIIIFLLILAIVLLFYKSIEPELPISQNKPKPKPILKKQSVQITPKPTSNVKFYDVRMSKLSNDIKIEKNQEPTSELLSQYKPAKEIVPTDNIYNCREQNKPIRFNI